MLDLYYAIVGNNTNTNEGVARFLVLIIGFIVIGGVVFWGLGG
jgi:uncharacterized protein (DUF983 family)